MHCLYVLSYCIPCPVLHFTYLTPFINSPGLVPVVLLNNNYSTFNMDSLRLQAINVRQNVNHSVQKRNIGFSSAVSTMHILFTLLSNMGHNLRQTHTSYM